MSRPPPSTAFPPLPKGATPLPPFPQLLHYHESPRPSRSHSVDFETDEIVMSPEEEDYEEAPSATIGTNPPQGGTTGGDGSSSAGTGKDGKKERKPHATRRRVVQSCSECRRRKIKCDKKFPCGPCILRSDQARCHEVGTTEKHLAPSSNFATTADLATIAHRIDAIEAALIKSGALIPADLEAFLVQIRSKTTSSFGATSASEPMSFVPATDPQRPDVSSSASETRSSQRKLSQSQSTAGPGQPQNEDDLSDTEGAALTLEHLAFGRSRVDGGHSLPAFGGRKASSVSRPVSGHNYHLSKSGAAAGESPTGPSSTGSIHDTWASSPSGHAGTSSLRKSSLSLGAAPLSSADIKPIVNMAPEERAGSMLAIAETMDPMDIFDMHTKRTDIVLSAMTKVLPTKERGQLLVHAYLDRVDWLHRIFHVPTFLNQCQDLWSLPKDRVVHEISMPFVALYLVVCTLGLHFMDSDEITKHFTPKEAHTLPDLWYSAARSAQWSSDFIGTHTLESLQTIILMSVLMNNRDRADAAWALLGAAIKMAQGLGLSRLGAEQQDVDGRGLPMWKGRWESLIQREVGRRIWWNLVFLDWALAPSYNYACSIQPDQIKTALPANVEDEDLIDGQPLRAQPSSVRTRMSFQLAKLKFAEISQRQIWQANNNNHPPYSFVLSVDRELRKAMLELPAFFQPDAASSRGGPVPSDPKVLVEHYENLTLSLAIHSRMLRLHRPWLSRGYEDDRFGYSKEQCIRAARASLRMMSDTHGVARFLEKWWIPLFYVTVSGMVVIIDLLKTAKREMKSKETDEKIKEVKGALDQMRHISETSIPARAAIKVMDFLLVEVEDRRRPRSSSLGKRKGESTDVDDEEHNLQRAVKRLIHQAQLEADSPSSASNSFVSPSSETNLPSSSEVGVTGTGGSGNVGNGQHVTPPASAGVEPTPERPVFGAYPMPPPFIKSASDQFGLGMGTGNGMGAVNGLTGNGDAFFNFGYNGSGAPAGPGSQFGGPQFQQQQQQQQSIQFPAKATNPSDNPLNYNYIASFTMPFEPTRASRSELNPGNNFGPTSSTSNFPQFLFDTSAFMGSTPNQAPQLDSTVESILANYFPSLPGGPGGRGTTDELGSAAVPQVPDDFLSRVFSFSWEAPGSGGGSKEGQQGNGGGNSQATHGQGQGQDGNGGQHLSPVTSRGSGSEPSQQSGVGQGAGVVVQGSNEGSGVQSQQNINMSQGSQGTFTWSSNHGWMA